MKDEQTPVLVNPAPSLEPSQGGVVQYADVETEVLKLVIKPFVGMSIGQTIIGKIEGNGTSYFRVEVKSVETLEIPAWTGKPVFLTSLVYVSFEVEGLSPPYKSDLGKYIVEGAPPTAA